MTKLQEERLLRLFRLILEAGPRNPEDREEEPLNTPPANTPPANTAPANAAPVNSKPANAAPVNTPPANTAPANAAPVNSKPANAPANSPANAPGGSGAPIPANMASNATPAANASGNAVAANTPLAIPGMDNDAPVNSNAAAVDSEDKIRQAKVKLFFDKLAGNDGLMNYLQFKSPLEQAEAIQKFAELVGVPRGQLMNVLNGIRQSANAAPANAAPAAPQAESVRRPIKEEGEGTVPPDLTTLKLYQLANLVKRDWKNVYFGAKPYLSAMSSLEDITDDYGMDSGKSIVLYFLSNASQWKGPVAKAVKTELKRRANIK